MRCLAAVCADDAHSAVPLQVTLFHVAGVFDALLAKLLHELFPGDQFRSKISMLDLTISYEQQ